MEVILSSETLVTTYKNTRRHNPEEHNPYFFTTVRTSNLRQEAYAITQSFDTNLSYVEIHAKS
jgi:hypothetical protein